MSNKTIVNLFLTAGSSVLSGAALGVVVQRRVAGMLEAVQSGLCVLDFEGVQCATASFLREAVFGMREILRRDKRPVQVLVANADVSVVEEIVLVARATGSSVVHARYSEAQGLVEPVVLGDLDDAQRETLTLLLAAGEATASSLAQSRPDIRTTAWNNRLASLVARGIVIESKRDRHKVFRPIVEGLRYGC